MNVKQQKGKGRGLSTGVACALSSPFPEKLPSFWVHFCSDIGAGWISCRIWAGAVAWGPFPQLAMLGREWGGAEAWQ